MSEVLNLDGSVTIVGASLAGIRSAEALRREGFLGTINLIGDETHPPYDRPPLSKQVLSGAWEPSKIVLADGDKLGDLGITAHLGLRATGFNAEARRVTLADGSALESDAVILATGAQLRRLPGTEGMAHVHGLRTLDDASALKADFDELSEPCSVVFIGAGFIGQEVATEAARRGHRVTILEGLDVPLSPIVGSDVGGLLRNLIPAEGVSLRCGVRVTGIEPAREGARAGVVTLEGGDEVLADLIVVGIGVVPSTGWLEDSGLVIENGIVCDEHLLAAPMVVAAGDVARFRWLGAGHDESVRIEHWQMAVDHAAYSAKVLLGGPAATPAFEAVPYFWSDVWGSKIQVLGHPTGADEAEVVLAPDENGRFLTLFHRNDQFTAVLGVSKPRQLMAYRALLAQGSSIADAMAVEV